VLDCICRKQKALVGEPCEHPLDVCMAMSQVPDAFAASPMIRALTRDEALATLRRAAEAGLVHSVSNNQEGLWYICNCCTCSCAILRGMVDLGMANVVARSAFVNQVDDAACIGCEWCLPKCQFNALAMDDQIARVNEARCVGCGVCVLACEQGALHLARRAADQVLPPPRTENDWRAERAAARGIKLDAVM
jgi:ferredoxin